MNIKRVGRGLTVVLAGAAMLTQSGCLGGSKNFTTGSGVAQAAGQTSGSAAGSVRPMAGPRIGNQAPDFELKDMDGNSVRLSDLRGKAVLVNFWATWCPPCREEMPEMEKAYQKYREQGIVFLGVDMQEDADTVRKFVKENRYSWSFLLDSDGKIARSYQAVAIPTSFFVDREGIIRDTHVGPIGGALLDAKLSKIR